MSNNTFTYPKTTEAGRTLLARVKAYNERISKATNEEEVEAIAVQADEVLRDGLVAMGYTPDQYRRVRFLNAGSNSGKGYADVVEAVRRVAAAGWTIHFPAYTALARAAFDDLVATARLGRAMDRDMGAISLDNGKGGFCSNPELLDPDVVEITRALIHEDRAQDDVKPLFALSQMLAHTVVKNSGVDLEGFEPVTLVGLSSLGEELAQSMALLFTFAGAGHVATAVALKDMLEAQERVGNVGAKLKEADPEHTRLVYSYDPMRKLAGEQMGKALDHIIKHGSAETLDTDALDKDMREQIAGMGPEYDERLKRAEAAAKDRKIHERMRENASMGDFYTTSKTTH